MENRKYWIRFTEQCDSDTTYLIFVPSGLTDSQILSLEASIEEAKDEWEDSHDDFGEYDAFDAIRDAFLYLGAPFEYPCEEHIIYM